MLGEFTKLVPEAAGTWRVTAAPHACPQCGRDIWADDSDFLYPRNRAFTQWRAGCNEHDFGCGFELVQDGTADSMLAAWNAVPRRSSGPHKV